MAHAIHAVTGFEKVAPFTLRVHFEDGTVQTIDFRPVLTGEIFGPLADETVFDQVHLDDESKTIVWPSGADFDPATLHDWPEARRERRREPGTSWLAPTRPPPSPRPARSTTC